MIGIRGPQRAQRSRNESVARVVSEDRHARDSPFKWTHADVVVVLISLYSLLRFLILFRTMDVLRTTRIANWSEFKSRRYLLHGEMSH